MGGSAGIIVRSSRSPSLSASKTVALLAQISTYRHCRSELQQLIRQLRRRNIELQTLLTRSNLSAEALNKTLGANPSINQVANAIQHICDMSEQQVNVEAALLQKLTYDSSASETQAIVAFFKGVLSTYQQAR